MGKRTRAAMAAFRPVLGAALVLGTWWVSTSFVPAVFTSSGPDGHAAALRGTAAGSTSSSSSGESAAGFGVAAPLGIALLGLAAVSRHQRSPAVSRQFFGGSSAAAPAKEVKSYADYKDPWLKRLSEQAQGGILGTADLGLDQGQGPVLLLGIGAQALAEYSKQRKENDGSFLSVEYDMNRCPGDLGFDPLGFGKSRSPEEFIGLHNAEVNLGRLAMIGTTTFIFKEFASKL